MSKDEYNKHVLQIQEWMKDEEEWKNGYSIKGRYGISANLVRSISGANAKDYMSIMER